MLFEHIPLQLASCVSYPFIDPSVSSQFYFFFTHYHSQGYFTFWVILSMIWGLVASCLCIFWPLWDARDTIACIFR